MAKAGIFFITQDVVISQNRNTAIFLRIKATYPGQPVTDANLKPCLIEPVFKFTDDGIAQIIRQRTERRATD